MKLIEDKIMRINIWNAVEFIAVFFMFGVLPMEANASPWGVGEDLPVSGFGSGSANVRVVFRPSNSTWYFDYGYNGTSYKRGPWAIKGDLPFAGDFDGDGKSDDVAVFRSSNRTWYYDFNHDGTTDEKVGPWGVKGDIPFAGDFDGDGKSDDVGVYRKSNDTEYIDLQHNGSTDGTGSVGIGANNCRPVVSRERIGDGGDFLRLFCDGEWWARTPIQDIKIGCCGGSASSAGVCIDTTLKNYSSSKVTYNVSYSGLKEGGDVVTTVPVAVSVPAQSSASVHIFAPNHRYVAGSWLKVKRHNPDSSTLRAPVSPINQCVL